MFLALPSESASIFLSNCRAKLKVTRHAREKFSTFNCLTNFIATKDSLFWKPNRTWTALNGKFSSRTDGIIGFPVQPTQNLKHFCQSAAKQQRPEQVCRRFSKLTRSAFRPTVIRLSMISTRKNSQKESSNLQTITMRSFIAGKGKEDRMALIILLITKK